jgi:SAM-dependent methyltransferase
LGSESDKAHGRWFRIFAEHYDTLAAAVDPRRTTGAAAALHQLFRRRGPVRRILDVACGTFSIDIGLVKRGYSVVGRDLSAEMIRVSRRNLRESGLRAEVAVADMRSLRVGRIFDALLCLGTAFNYLASPADVRRGLRTFRRHLRPGGLLVLDTTNFDPWINNPTNVRAEVDHRLPDGTRLAVFVLDDQDRARSLHVARFITAMQRGRKIDLAFDEARLRIWTKNTLGDALRREGFRPIEWWGDLKVGAKYDRQRSPRLVVVAQRA